MNAIIAIALLLLLLPSTAFHTTSHHSPSFLLKPHNLNHQRSLNSLNSVILNPSTDYEEIEVDGLTSSDFTSSEWKIGTLNLGSTKPSDITTTWVRLRPAAGDVSKFGQGRMVAEWGDGSEGSWR